MQFLLGIKLCSPFVIKYVLCYAISSDSSVYMKDFDVELDEMELIGAAARYYYYNSIHKQPWHCLSSNRPNYLTDLMERPEDACRDMLRMDKHVFYKLISIFQERGMLRDTTGVPIEEQLAIFLNIIGKMSVIEL